MWKALSPPLEAFFDKRAKHPVLLVETVEESANVTVLTEHGPGTSYGTAVHFHIHLPPLPARVRAERMQVSKSFSSNGLLR